jgi:hypothetical protein
MSIMRRMLLHRTRSGKIAAVIGGEIVNEHAGFRRDEDVLDGTRVVEILSDEELPQSW